MKIHPLIDSHAHLDFDRFDLDRDQVISRAHAAGIDTIITIGTDVQTSQKAFELTSEYDSLFCSAGIHPHEAEKFDNHDWSQLAKLWNQSRVVGVGETGLDYYYDFADKNRQKELFAQHLQAAQEIQKPVIIHIRDAFDDALDLMKTVGVSAGGVVHCFTGGVRECERILDLGLHISISGIVTFKNAQNLRDAVTMIPDDKLLVETDAPFLAPVPHRGQRNEPAFVIETTKEVARLRGHSIDAVSAYTRTNTIELFRLPIDALD